MRHVDLTRLPTYAPVDWDHDVFLGGGSAADDTLEAIELAFQDTTISPIPWLRIRTIADTRPVSRDIDDAVRRLAARVVVRYQDPGPDADVTPHVERVMQRILASHRTHVQVEVDGRLRDGTLLRDPDSVVWLVHLDAPPNVLVITGEHLDPTQLRIRTVA